jgi:exosortase
MAGSLISLYFLHQHRGQLIAAVNDTDRREPGIERVTTGLLFFGVPVMFATVLLAHPLVTGLFQRAVLALVLGGAVGGLVVAIRPVSRPLARHVGGYLGPILLALGIVGYALGIYPVRNDMVKGYSMIVALGGLVWTLGGGKVARITWFPVFYLIFIIRLSERAWEAIALKLQAIAAATAGVLLNLFGQVLGLHATVTGNTIQLAYPENGGMASGTLDVAQACSGLRMLMTFIALGFAVAYLADRPWWARLILVLLTIPIAVVINISRVTTLGLIYPYNQEIATGEFHILIGMLMLVPALGLFMLVGWILNQMFIDEPDLLNEEPAK